MSVQKTGCGTKRVQTHLKAFLYPTIKFMSGEVLGDKQAQAHPDQGKERPNLFSLEGVKMGLLFRKKMFRRVGNQRLERQL